MSFSVEWDFRPRAILLNWIDWPANGTVAMEVHRFAETAAPRLPSGAYHFRASDYLVHVRVDRAEKTLFVLGVHRTR
jgi:hypothetical protein